MLSRIELIALGYSAAAIAAGALLFGLGLLIDPARAARHALRRR